MKCTEHAIEMGKACEKLKKVLDFVPEGAMREHADEILEEGIYEYSMALIDFVDYTLREDKKEGLI